LPIIALAVGKDLCLEICTPTVQTVLDFIPKEKQLLSDGRQLESGRVFSFQCQL
jgi:hypothetical protein